MASFHICAVACAGGTGDSYGCREGWDRDQPRTLPGDMMWLVLAADAEGQRNKGEVRACGGDRHGPKCLLMEPVQSQQGHLPYGLCRGHVLVPLLMRQKRCCSLGSPGQLGELWDPLAQGWTLLAAVPFGRARTWRGQEAP